MATNTDTTNEPTGAPALPSKRAKVEQSVGQELSTSSEKTVADGIAIEPASLDTPESDAAIDDIVAHEADEVLAAQDAGVAAANADVQAVDDKPQKHGHPVFWFIIFVLAVLSLAVLYVLMNPGLELPFSA